MCLNPSQEPLCVGPDECGLGYAAERFVGRCESDTIAFQSANCDEGSSKPVEVAAGPDEIDSPCVDFYQSNVVLYHGHYLSFPTAYELALPPAWGRFDKGTDAWAEGDGSEHALHAQQVGSQLQLCGGRSFTVLWSRAEFWPAGTFACRHTEREQSS